MRFPHRATHADCCLRFLLRESLRQQSGAAHCSFLFSSQTFFAQKGLGRFVRFCLAFNLSAVLFVLRTKRFLFIFCIRIVAFLRVCSVPAHSTTGCLSQPLKSAPIANFLVLLPLSHCPTPNHNRHERERAADSDNHQPTITATPSTTPLPRPLIKHLSTGSLVCHAAVFTRSCLAHSLPSDHPLRSVSPTNFAPFGNRITTVRSSAVDGVPKET
jgi:hypothetical protein